MIISESENVTLDMIYNKLMTIEYEIKEINEDLDRVRPKFVEKLKEIEKEKTHSFNCLEDMEKQMDEEDK
jgi:hypothetical protein